MRLQDILSFSYWVRSNFFTIQIFLLIFLKIYFRKTKNTANIRQTNAARWFHWSG